MFGAALLFTAVVAACRCGQGKPHAPPIVGVALTVGSPCEDVLRRFPEGETLDLYGANGAEGLVKGERGHFFPSRAGGGSLLEAYMLHMQFTCVGPNEREVLLTSGHVVSQVPIWDLGPRRRTVNDYSIHGVPIWDSWGVENLICDDYGVAACLSLKPADAGCEITMRSIPFMAARVGFATGMGLAHGYLTGLFEFVGFAPAWMMDSLCVATAKTVGGDANKCTRTEAPNETPSF